MTTIYTVHKGDKIIGRCDAKCHEATRFDCQCCCGGAHHGVGTKAAIEDRNLLDADEIAVTCIDLHGPGRYIVTREPVQMELFS